MRSLKYLTVLFLVLASLASLTAVVATQETEVGTTIYVPQEYSFSDVELEQLGVFIEQVPFLNRGDSFLFTIDGQEYVLYYQEESVSISQEQNAIDNANFAISISEETLVSLNSAGVDEIVAALQDGSIEIEGRSFYASMRVAALRLVLLVL